MQLNKKRIMFEAFSKLAKAYPGNIDDERIKTYCEAFEDFELKDIHEALKKSLFKYKYFPSVSEINELINPIQDKKDMANEMVAEIFEAVKRFGYMNIEDAKKHLGPHVWFAVQGFGGWREVCLIEIKSIETARAQLRDMCMMSMNSANRKEKPDLLPFQRNSMKRLSNLIIEESNLLEGNYE